MANEPGAVRIFSKYRYCLHYDRLVRVIDIHKLEGEGRGRTVEQGNFEHKNIIK
jgi:hypothetical protein